MAIRSIAQLKAWFKRGLYPTQEQFHDWLDSFLHKEDKIAPSSVEGLTDQLNGKYPDADGKLLEQKTAELEVTYRHRNFRPMSMTCRNTPPVPVFPQLGKQGKSM